MSRKPIAGTWKRMPAAIQRAHVLALLPQIRDAVDRRDHFRVNVLSNVLCTVAQGALVFTPTPDAPRR